MPDEQGPEPRISIIIPVHNGGDDLRRCMASIAKAMGGDTEVIVVDDASDDEAIDAALMGLPEARVLRIDDGPVGPARARNWAAARARGEILVFVDADVAIRSNAIDELVSPLISSGPEGSLVATIGSYDDRPADPGVAATYANLRHHRVHQSVRNPVPGFWTGLGAVRRSVFEELEGFDEIFDRPSIEDVEFGLRVGASGRTIHVIPSAMGTHLKSWTIADLWRTDLFARGIPWGRAMELHPELGWSLNGSPRNRVAMLALAFAVLMSASSIASALAGMFGLAISSLVPAILGVGTWCWLEADLFRLIAIRRGYGSMLGGVFLHAIHHLTVPFACLAGVVSMRWSRSQDALWRKTLLGILILPAILSASVVAAGFIEAGLLVDWLSGYESKLRGIPPGEFTPQFDSAAVEGMKFRLPVLLVPILVMMLGILSVGPGRIRATVVSLRKVLIEALSLPRWLALASMVLMFLLLLGVLRNLGVPMRTDEAASLVSFGVADPFVIIGRYGTPNNHMLHSLLLWASIQVFGIEPWAVRLPALLTTLASVPLMAIAATRSWGRMAGLVAATIWVSMPITIELATNARGYPMVILVTLLMIALLPSLRLQRPGSGVLFVIAGVIGLISVPVMAYPLSILHAGLFLTRWGAEGIRAALRVVPLTVLTILLTAIAYLPGWIMATGAGPIEMVTGHMDHDLDWWGRLARTGSLIARGWEQWTWPLSGAAALLLLLPIGIGLVRGLGAGGVARMLASGSLIGTVAVQVLTGFAPTPWWTMVWALPFLILFVAFSCTPRKPCQGFSSKAESRGGLAGSFPLSAGLAVMVACAALLWISPEKFQREFAHRVGVGDVGVLADWLVEDGFDTGITIATGMVHGPINYELLRSHGLLRPVRIHAGAMKDPRPPIRFLLTRDAEARNANVIKLVPAIGRSGLVLVRRKEFGEILVLTFDRGSAQSVPNRLAPSSDERPLEARGGNEASLRGAKWQGRRTGSSTLL